MLLSSLLGGIFKRLSRSDARQSVESLLRRAHQLQREGDVAGARELCNGILSRNPSEVHAHCLLGRLHGQSGEPAHAIPHLEQAIALAPDLTEAHIALGNVHKLRGDGPAAETCYRNALACEPDSPAAHYNLALVLKHHGQHETALRHLDHACVVLPEFDDAMKEQVLCHIQLNRCEEAVSLAKDAAARRPESALLQACLGFAWQKAYRPLEALACYQRAQQLGHVDAEFFNNLGIVLQDLGKIGDALRAYNKALELQPDFPSARFHRALAQLQIGNYAAGWPDYEQRLVSEDAPHRLRTFPRWDGSALAARTILVYGEQGLGDEIMFASCVPQIVRQAGHCVIECMPKLESLFRRSFPSATVYAAASKDGPPPAALDPLNIDAEIPGGSLPGYLRREAGDFPRHHGYLRADPARAGHWRQRLAQLGPSAKIGISWHGGTPKSRSPMRSIPLTQWLPILRVSGVRFVSLQYADVHAAIEELRAEHGIDVAHWQEAIDDYDETAALVASLDLVISVCTAVIHLGGALGRPVWVIAPFSPEWRYGFAGEVMPWYPSVRIFRQPAYGQWDPVIVTVADKLTAWVATHSCTEARAERPQ